MAIVSDLPFSLYVITPFRNRSEKVTYFHDDEREVWNGPSSVSVEENEDVDILFTSPDKEARLYFDALDIASDDESVVLWDEHGGYYIKPSEKPFHLCRSDGSTDLLCVDTFALIVVSRGVRYYGSFQVDPKPMGTKDWQIMRDDLEREARGLAAKAMRRNEGRGEATLSSLSDFLILRKYSKQILGAITDINERPRYEIRTEYSYAVRNDYAAEDACSVRKYLSMAGSESRTLVPVKVTDHDIQDNRLLKLIINDFKKRLDRFVNSVDATSGEEAEGLSDFRTTAKKIKRMTSVLSSSDWYLGVRDNADTYIPHSFILDSRYNLLYQVYLKLKSAEKHIALDPMYSYTWKRSSYMYEMWSYFTICHILENEYDLVSSDWYDYLARRAVFPLLKSGTRTVFCNDKARLEVIFDRPLPVDAKETSVIDPLYIVRNSEGRNHNRPDIVIHIYSRENGWYIGTVILECKYRKVGSFWNSDPKRSSLGQLETYFNNARSDYFYDCFGRFFNGNPVHKVFVISPDERADGKTLPNFKVEAVTLRPKEDRSAAGSLGTKIDHVVEKALDGLDKIICPKK